MNKTHTQRVRELNNKIRALECDLRDVKSQRDRLAEMNTETNAAMSRAGSTVSSLKTQLATSAEHNASLQKIIDKLLDATIKTIDRLGRPLSSQPTEVTAETKEDG